jgi:MFS family permease
MARFSIAVCFFLAGLCFSSWASRIPDIKTLLALSDAQLGNVLFSLPAGLMVSLPLSGWMVTRFGSKRMLAAGIVLYACTLALIGLVAFTWQLVIILFAFGLWANLVNIAVNTQAVHVEKLHGRSTMAFFHGAWSLAGFLGAALALLFAYLDVTIQLHFLIVAMLISLSMTLLYKNLFSGETASSPAVLFARPDKFLLQLGVIGFFGLACEGAMFDWSGVYFQKIVQPPAALTALGYAAFMSTMTLGRFIGDHFTNRLGRKKMLQISGILIAFGLTMAIVLPSLATASLGFMFVGFGVSSVIPLVYGAAGKSASTSPGMALAAVSSISFLGFLLGPPVIGWIAQTVNLQYSFALIAVLGLCITLMTSKARLIQ